MASKINAPTGPSAEWARETWRNKCHFIFDSCLKFNTRPDFAERARAWAAELYNLTSEEAAGICFVMDRLDVPYSMQIILWRGVGLDPRQNFPIPGVGGKRRDTCYLSMNRWTGKYGRRRKRIARKMAMLLRACAELEYGCGLNSQIETV